MQYKKFLGSQGKGNEINTWDMKVFGYSKAIPCITIITKILNIMNFSKFIKLHKIVDLIQKTNFHNRISLHLFSSFNKHRVFIVRELAHSWQHWEWNQVSETTLWRWTCERSQESGCGIFSLIVLPLVKSFSYVLNHAC